MIYLHTCDVKRDVAQGTNGRATKQLFASGLKCLFIPMSSRAEIENNFTIGTAYDVYFPSSTQDVKTNDQLIWEGQKFNVRGSRRYVVPRVGHTHCSVTREGV